MKIRPLSTSIATLYLAPDNDVAPSGGSSPAPTIAADSSPTGMPIPTAPKPGSGAPAPIVVQPEPVVKQKGIINVKEALGLKDRPSKLITDESAAIRKRNERGEFIPIPKIKSKKPAEPAPAAEEAEPSAEPATPAPKAAEPTPAPAAPTKIKIGEKEMDPDEIAAHIAALEAKIKPATEPAPAATPAKDAPKNLTPQEQQAEDKRLDDEFVERAVAAMPDALDQAAFDKIIADGDVAAFNRLRVRDQLAVRKWMEKTINPIIEDLYKFRDEANGAVEMHRTIEQYQAEANFITANPDLKEHLAIARNVRKVLAEKYPKEWESMSLEERDKETAAAVRSLPIAKAAPVAPAVTPAPKAPAPRPKAPTGNVSGGGLAPGKAVDMSSPQYLLQRGKV